MQFNSYSYLLALFPFTVIYWLLPSAKARKWYLLIASAWFYASWNLAYAPLPFLLCGIAYLCARRIQKEQGIGASRWMWRGIGIVLAVLAFYKYRDFLLDNFNRILTLAGQNPLTFAWQVALPLGISFYSFEAISYLIDTRQGRVKEVEYPSLALFVTFFPHLIAGPIVRVRELVPQFSQFKQFDRSLLIAGLDRLLWGLVQKNVFANSLALFVNEGFAPAAIPNNSTIDNWTLTVAFGLQIYFDFASYSNMAIGTAKLLGITLPENFRFPYHAANPSDFWQRWHMTLSRWIRDYLFFPINAKYAGAPGPLYISLIVIMALVGLWHGAGWGFVLWGAMHGLWLVLYRIWERLVEKHPSLGTALWTRVPVRIATVAAVMAAWVPFRASTLADALTMLGSMTASIRWHAGYSINLYLVTAALSAFCVIEPWLVSITDRIERWLIAQRFSWVPSIVRPLVYAAFLLLFLIFDDQDVQFIYFQF